MFIHAINEAAMGMKIRIPLKLPTQPVVTLEKKAFTNWMAKKKDNIKEKNQKCDEKFSSEIAFSLRI